MRTSERSKKTSHHETHYFGRSGWIRAGVLGANDGVVSIAALVMALIAGRVSDSTFLITSLSALSAGAASMAIGEYVSVSSQKDIERADIAKEKRELVEEPDDELAELTAIYKNRGLSEDLAHKVAQELTAHDALGTHLRDELGIVEETRANPFQAAYVSLIAFFAGGALPFLTGILVYKIFENSTLIQLSITGVISIVALVCLGWAGAKLGGAPIRKAVIRVCVGGTLALVLTSLLGAALA